MTTAPGSIQCAEQDCPGSIARGLPPRDHSCPLGAGLYGPTGDGSADLAAIRSSRLTFADHPADPADYLPPEPARRRYMLRLTPNGAPPLADTVASLDRLLIVFTIGASAGPEITPERIAEHVITSLNLAGRVHLVLEPIPANGDDPS
jgi:hypothetical protein